MDAALTDLITRIHATPPKLVLEFAGAGTMGLAWLHGVGGSSRTILEATDRYAAASMIEALGAEPEQFAAPPVAHGLARHALRRAQTLAPGEPLIGVGCTAAIATDRPKRGQHRAYIAVWTEQARVCWGLTLKKGARSREAEEALISRLLVRAIGGVCGLGGGPQPELLPGETLVRHFAPHDLLSRLMQGEVEWVAVGPEGAMRTGVELHKVVLVPGSFNPLHRGHRELAEAAGECTGRPVYFELTVTNPDKPAIGPVETRRRMAQFRGWGTVLLTRAPLFRDKARLFPGSAFVIGADTAERLVQPRFYGGSPTRMEAALQEIRAAGCRFLVAGRQNGDGFVQLADISLPVAVADLFEEIKDFRIDISSTAIREGLK